MLKKLSRIIQEPPPQSKDGLNAEKPVLSIYHSSFEPFFNKLADNYNSRFEWLGNITADKVANIGFGEEGAETFALMWALDATEAIGFDKEDRYVKNAERNRKVAYDFINEAVPMVLKSCNPDYKGEFIAWYEGKVSNKIRDVILPDFKRDDLTEGIEWNSDYFGLVYSRYVVDKIKENDRLIALQEMVRIAQPNGYIIIVAPEDTMPRKDQLDILGVTWLKTVGKDKLGKLECPNDELRGEIFIKN